MASAPYRFAALAAGVLMAATVAPTPAQASSLCGAGQFCAFQNAGYKGAKLVLTGDRSSLGSWDNKISSFINHSGKTACLYPNSGYRPGTYPIDFWIDSSSKTGGIPFVDGGFDNTFSSIEFVTNMGDCGLPKARPNWAGRPLARPGALPAAARFGDLTGDGIADLVVRNQAGELWSLSGAGGGTARLLAGGWNSRTAIVRHGDYTGDTKEDLLVRDSAGKLWLYPGKGNGTFGGARGIWGNWKGFTALVGVGDLDRDGHNDLLARDGAGKLWLYPGKAGTFGSRRSMWGDWKGFTALVGVGDLNQDGYNDLLARDSAGRGWLYPGTAGGTFGSRKRLPGSWNTADRRNLTAVGDVTGDGVPDVLAHGGANSSAGNLEIARPLDNVFESGMPMRSTATAY